MHPFTGWATTPTDPARAKAVRAAEGDHLRPVPAVSTSQPSCVYACPHDALKRVEPAKFFGIPK